MLHHIHKEKMKELKKRFPFGLEVPETGKDEMSKIKLFLTSLTIALIEGEIEKLKNKNQGENNGDVFDGYNQALDDHISYLTEQLEEIKKQ